MYDINLSYSLSQLMLFILILVRVTIMIWFFPLFPKEKFAQKAKLAFSICLSIVLVSVVKQETDLKLNINFILLLFKEIGAGITLGFMIFLLSGIIRSLGIFISHLIGLEIAKTIAPTIAKNEHASVLSLICFYLGIISLILLDGHHFIIYALATSFEIIPIGKFTLEPELFSLIFQEWLTFMRFIIVIAAPFILFFFTVTIELGFLGKMIPQLNIFLMEYPLRIAGGLLIMAWFLPAFVVGLQKFCFILQESLNELL